MDINTLQSISLILLAFFTFVVGKAVLKLKADLDGAKKSISIRDFKFVTKFEITDSHWDGKIWMDIYAVPKLTSQKVVDEFVKSKEKTSSQRLFPSGLLEIKKNWENEQVMDKTPEGSILIYPGEEGVVIKKSLGSQGYIGHSIVTYVGDQVFKEITHVGLVFFTGIGRER